MNKVMKIYKTLYKEYGPQGWWPFINYEGKNTSKEGNTEGYHVLDYSFPRNKNEVQPITWRQFDWLMSGLEIEQPKAIRPRKPENEKE